MHWSHDDRLLTLARFTHLHLHTHVSCVFDSWLLFSSSFNCCAIIDLPLNVKHIKVYWFPSVLLCCAVVILLLFRFGVFFFFFLSFLLFLHYLFGVQRQWRIRTLRKTNVCLTASRFLRVGPVALCICFVITCCVCYLHFRKQHSFQSNNNILQIGLFSSKTE